MKHQGRLSTQPFEGLRSSDQRKPDQDKRTKNRLSNNKMPAPSPLVIATSVLTRYVKEENSYHKELEQQSARIAKLEAGEDADNENAEFILRQQVSSRNRKMSVSK
jgi:hypothetical protein